SGIRALPPDRDVAEPPTMTTLILAAALLRADAPPPAGRPPAYKVLHVPDGESLVLAIDGKTVRVFLLGVEGPDPDHERATRAPRARFLHGLLAGQSVRLGH